MSDGHASLRVSGFASKDGSCRNFKEIPFGDDISQGAKVVHASLAPECSDALPESLLESIDRLFSIDKTYGLSKDAGISCFAKTYIDPSSPSQFVPSD